MASVILRAPLSELCAGRSHALPGGTVLELLAALESTHPAVAGWILDERGLIREHINIYLNGEPARGETRVGRDDRVHVLPAITGG